MWIWGDGVWGDGVWGGPTPLYDVTLQPVDLLALQSGQATAGVTAELAVLELDMMGEQTLALSAAAGQFIPAGRVP